MKSMMAELTDSTNIAQAFALMPVVFSIGATIGPFIGGTLARPSGRFPMFHGAFWKKYPYFLPCAVSAAYSALAFLLGAVFLKETLPKAIYVPDTENRESNNTKPSRESPVPLRELLVFPILISISNYATLAFIEIAWLALLPLFYSSPIEHGGLNFSPSTIGVLLGIFGLANGVFQAFFFAKFIKRWGAKNVFIIGMSSFLPIFLLFPVMNLLARRWGHSPIVWMAVACQLVTAMVMDMAYPSIFIFITSASPNKRSLGATNGLGQTVVSVLRALGPALSTSLFALSLEHNLLGGYAVYVVLLILSGLSLLLAVRLPNQPWQRNRG
jgi:MFS family permease